MEYDPATRELIAAVKRGNVEDFRAALSRGGNAQVAISVPSRNVTWCLLALAASHGHTSLLCHLVDEEKMSVEGSGTDDRTPLMLAATHGHSDMVERLLSLGANPLSRDKHGYNALHGAALKGHLSCVSLLVDHTPTTTVNYEGETPVHSASFGGHVKVIEQLKRAGWSLSIKDSLGRSALHWAARKGHFEAVQYLVEKARLDPLQKCHSGTTPLDYGAIFGHHRLEGWLVKHVAKAHPDSGRTLHLMKLRKIYDEKCYEDIISKVIDGTTHDLHIDDQTDFHLTDPHGHTFLHTAAELGISSAVETLLGLGVHPHVVNLAGQTPVDLAQRFGHTEVVSVLQSHPCAQSDFSPEELYKELLDIIQNKDDVREVSALLCAGCPLYPVGDCTEPALRLAAIHDRPRTFNLLLAAGATPTRAASSNMSALLQEAWSCPNVTSAVLTSLITAYINRLCVEKDRLSSPGNDNILKGISCILHTLAGDKPWTAAWPMRDAPDHAYLTGLMADAAKANCPVTAAFLQQAGAWCFFSGTYPSPLHAALEAGHWCLAELLVRDLEGCLYATDAYGRLPLHIMQPDLQNKLERVMYQKERSKLLNMKTSGKDKGKQDTLETTLQIQEQLFFGSHDVVADNQILLLIVRNGFLQLTHLLLKAGCFSGGSELDVTSGTTALHEAAAHGRTGCANLLLAADGDPLRRDRYGQTPLLLAAMFGHTSTFQLLAQAAPQEGDVSCRAGTTAHQTKDSYSKYLQLYTKLGDEARDSLTIFDRQDETQVMKKILGAINHEELLRESRRVNVDFSHGEALLVKRMVVQEMESIMRWLESRNPVYKGSLHLVGSSYDGSKLYSPDEFDFNLIIYVPGAEVTVENNPDWEQNRMEPQLQILVNSRNDALRGNRFMADIYEEIKGYLVANLLHDKRLSIVPPGLTQTRVGVSLAMAWQGEEHPLLLVSVDLVPVLVVPWDGKVTRPFLTPSDTTHMHITNTVDGSWRCSFANVEAKALSRLTTEERLVYLVCKTLLSCLKAERWMPHELKAIRTWFCAKVWKLPVPKVFCLKSSFLQVLEDKRKQERQWREDDAMTHVRAVLQNMCTESLKPKLMYAYFGGECEGPTNSIGADVIIKGLKYEN